jgi:hypothetical protein
MNNWITALAHWVANLYKDNTSQSKIVEVLQNIELIITKVFYSPTDAQVNCVKNNSKIHNKIYIKRAPIRFGAIAIIRERSIRAC